MILIEALVGILIFSIGILAMLGMQTVGIQTTVDAKYRSDAAFLANQVVSQIWVDQTNIASYDTSASSYAPRDAWVAQVQSALPKATGANAPTITVTSPPESKVTVTVYWQKPGDPQVNRQMVIAYIKCSNCT
jgi:type IV pilus assembly protein PilV